MRQKKQGDWVLKVPVFLVCFGAAWGSAAAAAGAKQKRRPARENAPSRLKQAFGGRALRGD